MNRQALLCFLFLVFPLLLIGGDYPEVEEEVAWLEKTPEFGDSGKRDKLAELLTEAARTAFHQPEADGRMERVAKLLFLAETIAPEFRKAVVMKFQLQEGLNVPIAEASEEPSVLADRLKKAASELVAKETDDAKRLAAAFYEQAVFLNAADADAIYEYQMLLKKGANLPWDDLFGRNKEAKEKEPEVNRAALEGSEKRVEKINILLVASSSNRRDLGKTNKMIATLKSRLKEPEIRADFAHEETGDHMKIARDEAVRLVTLKLPPDAPGYWFDVSFEDKYTPTDGGSLGTALTTLLLSFVEGFKIDPRFAVTGDITVDGGSEKIGGVFEKLEAARDKNGVMGVVFPEENRQELIDYCVLNGVQEIEAIQIFTVKNVAEAIDLLSEDKPEDLTQAIKKYDEWRKKGFNRDPKTLVEVLELAPNQLTAQIIQMDQRGSLPKRMSLPTSVRRLFVATSPFVPGVFNRNVQQKADADEVRISPHSETICKQALVQLNNLNFKIAPEAAPLQGALYDYVEAWQEIADLKSYLRIKTGQKEEIIQTRAGVLQAYEKLGFDEDLAKELFSQD